MRPHPLALTLTLLAGCATSQLPAQRSAVRSEAASASVSVSAPITDIRYDVTFDAATARRRMLRVAMTFAVDGSGPVLLSLPAWTPGAYEMSWFAKWVANFGATADGRPVTWDKTDYDTWRINAGRAKSVTVSFDYQADTLDNAMAWTRPDFVFFNGTNVFLYPEGRSPEFAATVTVRTEPRWRVVTGMKAGSAPRSYVAGNYHDLVDMPFFVGQFDVDSMRVADRWMRLATYPSGSVAGEQRQEIWSQLAKMVPPQVKVFGEVPWDTYTVMQVADSTFGGASGLEHQNSHIDVISPFAIGNPIMPSLYAHEIFHAWNVKRLRPVELWPYRYDQPQPTTLLWMSEGVTDYYADLALVRGGIVDSTGFMETTAGKINEVASAPAVALEDASLSTWVHPTDGSAYIYYPKGSLAGFLLDILIRDASDNKRSLDDVLRELYTSTFKAGQGFSEQQWWAAVSRAAGGKSFADFEARYIDGREAYPWATTLPLAGFRLVVDSLRLPRLGIATLLVEDKVRITEVEPGSASATAGVRAGDVLVAIGDIPVEDTGFAARFRSKFGSAAEGTPLALRVERDGQTLTLTSRLRFDVRTQSRIVADAAASGKAARIRSGILRGTTDG